MNHWRENFWRRQIAFITMSMLFAASTLAASPPTTRPAHADDDPATRLVRTNFEKLADPDPAVRRNAYDALLQLDRSSLPVLEQVVRETSPLAPNQRANLRDIVDQLYLSAESYDANPNLGFMGVRLDDAIFEGGENGVLIVAREPGFCGYKAFHDGDIVTGIAADPFIPFHNATDMVVEVPKFMSGQTVVFEVLRENRKIHVAVRLDARPLAASTTPEFEALLGDRRQAANEYWDSKFAPLVETDTP